MSQLKTQLLRLLLVNLRQEGCDRIVIGHSRAWPQTRLGDHHVRLGITVYGRRRWRTIDCIERSVFADDVLFGRSNVSKQGLTICAT